MDGMISNTVFFMSRVKNLGEIFYPNNLWFVCLLIRLAFPSAIRNSMFCWHYFVKVVPLESARGSGFEAIFSIK